MMKGGNPGGAFQIEASERTRSPSTFILFCWILTLLPATAWAVPPEVTNLQFRSEETMSWDFLPNVQGYNIYRSTYSRIAAGDYGDCLIGSHRSTSLGDLGTPPIGVLYSFLAVGFDETGEGTLGTSNGGVTRTVPTPCKPARRYADFQVNGNLGDGVVDGVTPARNPAAPLYFIRGEKFGVYSHSGEFHVTVEDLAIPARDPGSSEVYDSEGSGESFADESSAEISRGSLIDRCCEYALEGFDDQFYDCLGQYSGLNPGDYAANLIYLQCFGLVDDIVGGGEKSDYYFPTGRWGDASSLSSDLIPVPGYLVNSGKGNLRGTRTVEGFDCPSVEACDYYYATKQCRLYNLCYDAMMECWLEAAQNGPEFPAELVALDLSSDLLRKDCDERMRVLKHKLLRSYPASGYSHRSFRSQVAYDGPLGYGWDCGTNERLAPEGGDVRHYDGRGRSDTFQRVDATHFDSPAGIYGLLLQNPDNSFTLRDPDGTLRDFHAFDGSNLEGAIKAVEDRAGNRTTFQYDHQGLLTTITDTMGRAISYGYDTDGRITSVTDFVDRQVQYSYDTNGDLVSVRSPPVTGTPNGNDFPGGKITTYTYSSGYTDEKLNHNLTAIILPNEYNPGSPAVQIIYGTDPTSFHFDRVIAQTIGGTNDSGVPAGGTLTYTYESLNPGVPTDTDTPRRKATVTDRNGNQKELIHNHAGNLLSRTDYTNRNLRPEEPDYTTLYAYNLDGELIEATLPEGNRLQFTHDTASPNRGNHGNLLQIQAIADNPATGPGRGDGHGGSIPDRVWSFTYEPVFNRIASSTDPRGNDPGFVPPNGGTTSPARYRTRRTYDYQEGDPGLNGISALASRFGIALGTTPLNLGDQNGDGITLQAAGNPVKVEFPTVNLDPSSNQAAIEGDTTQEVVSLFEWNSFGQPTSMVDPEGNRHEFEYYQETDPDGDGTPTPTPPDGRTLDGTTGGYLKTRLLDTISSPGQNNGTDPTPAMVRHDFEYDQAGNLTGFIDGRGVLTRYVVNQLNQVVEVRRAAATADASGPWGDPPTGRGETGLTAFGFRTRYEYDANDNLVKREVEDVGETRGLGPFLETTWTHDLLGNPVEVSREATTTVNLVTRYRYDGNENLTRIIEPEGNAHEWEYDERDLLLARRRGSSGPRGGVPSVLQYVYDTNGNLSRITDALGGLIDLEYDGFDRPARRIDQAGNTLDLFYDPVSNVVRLLRRGPPAGPTPTDRSGSSNVDLADTLFLHDELNRSFRRNRFLFVPSGVTPARTPDLNEGPLIPTDGFINTNREYDRLSRPTFMVRDSGAITRLDYDGVGRLARITLPGGAGQVEWTYDGGHNPVEVAGTEVSSTGSTGPPDEEFLTTRFFDALNRPVMVADNLGQTWRAEYDSLNRVTTTTDARGPAGGSISRRSPGRETMTVAVNGHGNVTNFSYDGLGRLLTTTSILTASGEGDGTLTPSPDTSNSHNPDGSITLTREWDGNSLPAGMQDDRGNSTTYDHDNLNRLVLFTADDGTTSQYNYDAQGNLTSRTDPNGTIVSHTYDAAHRRVESDVSPAAGVEGTTEQRFEYDGLSRLTLATDNNDPTDGSDDVTVGLFYDSLGRVIEEGQHIGSGTGGEVLSTDFGWLAADLLTDLIYPSGRHIQYGFDGADRLVSVGDMDTGRTEGASYDYFGLGRVHTRDFNNGVRSTRLDDAGTTDIGFDGVGRTTLFRHIDSTAGTLVAGYEYRYDGVSNPTSHRRLHHQGSSGGDFKGEVYAYDSADRLISFQEGILDSDHDLVLLPDDIHAWLLDGAGNWSEMTRNGVNYLATPNNLNEYDEPQSGGTRVDDGVPDDFLDDASTSDPDGLNLAHDRNGNQINIGLFGIGYDFLNRPVRVTRNSDSMQVAQYAYDAFGRRATRRVTNSGSLDQFRRYLYGKTPNGVLLHEVGHSFLGFLDEYVEEGFKKEHVVEERDGTDGVIRQIAYARGPLWQVLNDGSSQYFLEDPFENIVALFDEAIVERVTYDPYGKPTFESPGNIPLTDVAGNFLPRSLYGNPNLFRGMRYDPETGGRTNDVNTDLGGLYNTGFLRLFAFDGITGYPRRVTTQVPDPASGAAGAAVYYNPNQGRCLFRDPFGVFPDTLLFGNRYGLFANNPVKSFLETVRKHSNRSTIANRADPYTGGTTPPPTDTPP